MIGCLTETTTCVVAKPLVAFIELLVIYMVIIFCIRGKQMFSTSHNKKNFLAIPILILNQELLESSLKFSAQLVSNFEGFIRI